jgi:hypothetical protein
MLAVKDPLFIDVYGERETSMKSFCGRANCGSGIAHIQKLKIANRFK